MFLALNPRGFSPEQREKIIMVKRAIKYYETDALLFSSPDRIWNQRLLDYLEVQFRKISNEIKIIASDSGEDTKKGIGHLPGGIKHLLLGKA